MLNTHEAVLVMVDFQGKLVEMVHQSEGVLPNALMMILSLIHI